MSTRPLFLLLHTTHLEVVVALYNDATMVLEQTLHPKKASSLLAPTIKAMLAHSGATFKDLTALMCTRGPAPFTTLRTVLATAQGLSYASGKNIVGIDGLTAHLTAIRLANPGKACAVMLNAFAGDVYLISSNADGQLTEQAQCLSFTWAQQRLNDTAFHWVIGGNMFLDQAALSTALPACLLSTIQAAPAQSIFQAGYAAWQAGERGSDTIAPLYLKDTSAILKPMQRVQLH